MNIILIAVCRETDKSPIHMNNKLGVKSNRLQLQMVYGIVPIPL